MEELKKRTLFYRTGELDSILGSATDTLHPAFNVLFISSMYPIAECPSIYVVDSSCWAEMGVSWIQLEW